jgi:hypothetical protein
MKLTFIDMLIILAVVLIMVPGCASYNIQRCEGNVCSTAEIKSPRKFKSISFKYNGTERTFELAAGDVGTDVSAINTLASVILLQAQQSEPANQ